MRIGLTRPLIAATAVIAIGCLTVSCAADPGAAPAAPAAASAGGTPRTADGKVDFSGIWDADRKFINDIHDAMKPGETLPLQPWALKVTMERMSKDDPEANCLPTGVPRQAPYPWRILQTPTHMFFLFEGNIHSYRQIFLDGRPHPDDLDPTWYGHSIGSWDGDTLVIDTIGFNDRFWFDFAGHPHTERLHTIERFRRPDAKTLQYQSDDRRSGGLHGAVHALRHSRVFRGQRAHGVHLQREQPGRGAHRREGSPQPIHEGAGRTVAPMCREPRRLNGVS